MRHHCRRPMRLRPFFAELVRPILSAAIVLAMTSAPGLAQDCPTWSFTGSFSAGDGSTVPGGGALWSTCCPAPAGYYGDFQPNTPIEISGGGTAGDGDWRWYVITGGYFWSPIGGYMHCERDEASGCGYCTGDFDLKVYASQGAVEGRVTIIPEPEQGLAGHHVRLSRNPDGGGALRYTDETGHYEFRAEEGLARSNNWGVYVDPTYDPWPHSGMGRATYYVGTTGAAIQTVEVTSSQLANADLVIRHPRVEDPEMRCDSGGGAGGGWGPNPPSESAGEPVNVITGNVYFDQTDIVVPGVQGLAFVRSYNSKNAFNELDSDFSRGWSHSYSRELTFPDSISIDFRSDDGVPALYYQDVDGDGIFDAALPATDRTRIVREGESYRREFKSGAYETYDPAGRLTSIVDTSNNVTVLERNSKGLLSRVTDPGGRFLAFSYDDRDRLTHVEAGSVVVAAYEYDASNFLRRVGYPDGSGYVFTYEGHGQVVRVEDASGRAIESHTYGSYDLASFALTSEIADGQEKLTFTYEPWRTTVTDALGNSTVYDWRWVNGLRRVVKITGPCSSCGGGTADTQEWVYDDVGRIEEYRENEETPTRYTYDAEGRLETVTDPLGRITRYTYDDEDRLLTIETPGGGLVTTTYGDHGPLTITEKVTEATSRTTTYTYTTRGQVETVTDPRGKVTTYGYETDGDLETVTDPLGHVTRFSTTTWDEGTR